MKIIFQRFLFRKNYFVFQNRDSLNDDGAAFILHYALQKKFGIKIKNDVNRLQTDMLMTAAAELGYDVAEPFFRGFPFTVKELPAEVRAFEQMIAYASTYGLNYFEEAGHSIFEDFEKREGLTDEIKMKEFIILTEDEAEVLLQKMADDYCAGTRPLSDETILFLQAMMDEYHYIPAKISSKNTVIRLLVKTDEMELLKFLKLSDVLKVVDEINFNTYGRDSIKKLNLINADRKFIAQIIDNLTAADRCDVVTCFEKKREWNGLLHHIHYKPKNEAGKTFVNAMRGKENQSVYSAFEKAMAERDIKKAVDILYAGKGGTMVLRKLDYLVSNCLDEKEIDYVLDHVTSSNGLVLYQLLNAYNMRLNTPVVERNFVFKKRNLLKVHKESFEDAFLRKTNLSSAVLFLLSQKIKEKLSQVYKDTYSKVYVDDSMKGIALPIESGTAAGGYGTKTTGSRMAVPAGKVIRAFTYWKGCDDIDLSVLGINRIGNITEFSWRTVESFDPEYITYSGDETAGFHGGSEYFDIDLNKMREEYPNIRYLVLCNNVYSGYPFSMFTCRAGFMMRENVNSGEVYEPATVENAFTIDKVSTFAYLYAIDMDKNEIIWLNCCRNKKVLVAGETLLDCLEKYFRMTDCADVYSFAGSLAAEKVDDPACADIIFSDTAEAASDKQVVVRSYDTEKLIALLNGKRVA